MATMSSVDAGSVLTPEGSNVMLSERAWLEYRLDVVSSWPQGTRRAMSISAILARMQAIEEFDRAMNRWNHGHRGEAQ
jgi:hypothetical protein